MLGPAFSLLQTRSDTPKPPDALPPAEWTTTSWVGLLLYVFLFLLAAWWIYRLAALKGPESGEGEG